MPKMKSHKGTAKRYKKTGSGKWVSVLLIASNRRSCSSGESRSAVANGARRAACRISLAYARPMPVI